MKSLQEYMRTMGLSNWMHWIAHFLTNLALLAIVVFVVTLLLKVPIGGAAVVENTDPTLLFVFLLLYAVDTICCAFAVSSFFQTGN